MRSCPEVMLSSRAATTADVCLDYVMMSRLFCETSAPEVTSSNVSFVRPFPNLRDIEHILISVGEQWLLDTLWTKYKTSQINFL